MDAKCSWQPSTSATDEKQEEGRAVIQANRSECNNRRNCFTTRRHWRYCIFFSVWHSCVPQGGCPNIWVKGISATASTSAVVFWSVATIKVMSWIASSLGGESWVHRHEPETKWWSMPQKHKSSSSKKSKSRPSASRLLLTVFWDFQGPILERYTDRDIMIINVNYCNILGNALRLAIRTKLRSRLS